VREKISQGEEEAPSRENTSVRGQEKKTANNRGVGREKCPAKKTCAKVGTVRKWSSTGGDRRFESFTLVRGEKCPPSTSLD